ncbi:MAG: hypothetical protein AB7G11_16530 [Phycisphaerales bacterium]
MNQREFIRRLCDLIQTPDAYVAKPAAVYNGTCSTYVVFRCDRLLGIAKDNLVRVQSPALAKLVMDWAMFAIEIASEGAPIEDFDADLRLLEAENELVPLINALKRLGLWN